MLQINLISLRHEDAKKLMNFMINQMKKKIKV